MTRKVVCCKDTDESVRLYMAAHIFDHLEDDKPAVAVSFGDDYTCYTLAGNATYSAPAAYVDKVAPAMIMWMTVHDEHDSFETVPEDLQAQYNAVVDPVFDIIPTVDQQEILNFGWTPR